MKKRIMLVVGCIFIGTGLFWAGRLFVHHISWDVADSYAIDLTGQPLRGKTAKTPDTVPTPTTVPACQINGHDCLEVVQKLTQTEIVYSQAPETEMTSWDVQEFKNQALKEMGISVDYYATYRDGGSQKYYISYTEEHSPQITVFKNYKIGSKEQGFVTITWEDGSQKKFDTKGNLVL